MLLLVMLLAAAGAAVAAAAGGKGSPTARGGGSSNGPPPPDPGIHPAEWAAVQTALAQETDPEMLDAFALVLDNQGFHHAATMLRQKAVTLGG